MKARFSNQHKRLRFDFLEDFSHYWSLSSTLKHYGGVKSDAKMTPTVARRICDVRPPVFSLKRPGTAGAVPACLTLPILDRPCRTILTRTAIEKRLEWVGRSTRRDGVSGILSQQCQIFPLAPFNMLLFKDYIGSPSPLPLLLEVWVGNRNRKGSRY